MATNNIATAELLNQLSEQAKASPRKRMNYNFHKSHDYSGLHVLLNAIEPESYTQPHRHVTPRKDECFSLVRGVLAIPFFDDSGEIKELDVLSDGDNAFVYIPAGEWHSILSYESGSIVLECKVGPYSPPDKEFASFAPSEDEMETARAYLKNLKTRIDDFLT